MNKRNWIILAFIACLGIIVQRCAHPVSPTGGPKDTTPPGPVVQLPPDRTTGFDAKKITLTFDEFISLKDPAKEIFISPPMKTRPLIKVKSKSVIVEFQEDLKPNSTYTINFGNAIVDYTEANPFSNYEYVFSTGAHIDSLSISGKVISAFNHQPEADILVMLYRDINDTLPLDSLPMHTPPVSASKTIKDGSFRVNNLAEGEYLLFALQDLNSNFMFDLSNEKISFLDSLLVLIPPEPFFPETDSTDTTFQAIPAVESAKEKQYILYLFEEVDSTQKLLGKKLTLPNLISYYFRMPADSLEFTLIGPDDERPDWYIPEYSKNKDTINLWLQPDLPDTLRVRMAAGSLITDTSRFILTKVEPARLIKKKDEKSGQLRISSSIAGGMFGLNQDFRLLFPGPIQSYDSLKIILTSATDTLSPPILFTDSIRRNCIIEYAWPEGESFRLTLLDSAFIDITGQYNDSTTFFFKVRKLSDYGNLFLQVRLPADSMPCIIQLLTEKDALVREEIIHQSGLYRFELLMPGKYKLKAIHDSNLNGKWDTGNYRSKLGPETIEYYAPGITVRANWDLQEEWKLE